MEKTRIRIFKENDIILHEDENHSEMFKILSGNVLLYFHYGKDDEYLVGAAGKNRVFGEFGLLTGKPELYTVVANDDVTAMAISEDELNDFLINNHNNAREIMNNMAKMCDVMKTNLNMLVDELSVISERDKRLITRINDKLMRYKLY